MLRFSSPAAGDIYMLDAHARRLLEIIGKKPGERGVIVVEDIPAALAALRAAIEQERSAEAQAGEPDEVEEEPDGGRTEQPVRLSQRAFPLIDMLERAQRHGKDVLWGV